MNSNYISLIAMLVAVFFSGVYLRGEAARKREVKRELDTIRDRQEEIMAQVEEINRVTVERDQRLISQIDSARSYIDILNAEETLTSEKIAERGDKIEQLQKGIDSSLAEIQGSSGFALPAPAVEVAPSGQ